MMLELILEEEVEEVVVVVLVVVPEGLEEEVMVVVILLLLLLPLAIPHHHPIPLLVARGHAVHGPFQLLWLPPLQTLQLPLLAEQDPHRSVQPPRMMMPLQRNASLMSPQRVLMEEEGQEWLADHFSQRHCSGHYCSTMELNMQGA